MHNLETFRPRTSLIFAGIGTALCGLFIWSSFYQGGVTGEVTSTLVALFVAICIYIFLVRPRVVFSDEGIVIINPIDEFTIGWADVIQMDTRWALSIETQLFTVSSWAGASTGRPRRNIHYEDVKGLNIEIDGAMRVSDSPYSDSGAAAYRAKIRLKRFQDSGTHRSLTTAKKRHLQPVWLGLFTLSAAILVNFVGH